MDIPRPRRTWLGATVFLLAPLAACSGTEGSPEGLGEQPATPQPTTQTATVSPSPSNTKSRPKVKAVVASGLKVPWGVAFLPDGTALVGERDTARVLAIDATQKNQTLIREVGQIEVASPIGEAGLLGLAVSPSYVEDQLIYAYASTAEDNRVLAMTYDGEQLGEPEPILTGIPNGQIHDGGRLQFGPDGYLYISTGETGVPDLAQDVESLGGKILRVTPEGKPAPGNPLDGSPVWSMGHRNVQGLAFDNQERLWATEFGQQTWDELNRVDKGRNYGWPLVEGDGDLEEFRNPFVKWATADASPSGLAFLDGSLWAGALRGQRLWEIPVTDGGVGRPQDWFVGDFGRIRTVTPTPEGDLWVTTSNRDGRGEPVPDDDRILLVSVG